MALVQGYRGTLSGSINLTVSGGGFSSTGTISARQTCYISGGFGSPSASASSFSNIGNTSSSNYVGMTGVFTGNASSSLSGYFPGAGYHSGTVTVTVYYSWRLSPSSVGSSNVKVNVPISGTIETYMYESGGGATDCIPGSSQCPQPYPYDCNCKTQCVCACNCDCECECGSDTECQCDCVPYDCNCDFSSNCDCSNKKPVTCTTCDCMIPKTANCTCSTCNCSTITCRTCR